MLTSQQLLDPQNRPLPFALAKGSAPSTSPSRLRRFPRGSLSYTYGLRKLDGIGWRTGSIPICRVLMPRPELNRLLSTTTSMERHSGAGGLTMASASDHDR